MIFMVSSVTCREEIELQYDGHHTCCINQTVISEELFSTFSKWLYLNERRSIQHTGDSLSSVPVAREELHFSASDMWAVAFQWLCTPIGADLHCLTVYHSASPPNVGRLQEKIDVLEPKVIKW